MNSSSNHNNNQDEQNHNVSATNNNSVDALNEQLAAESVRIQLELDRLKTRRRMIEEQRRALAAAAGSSSLTPQRNSNTNNNSTTTTTTKNNNNHNNESANQSRSASATRAGRHHQDPSSIMMVSHQYNANTNSSSRSPSNNIINTVTHSGDLPLGGTKRKEILPESKRRSLLLQHNSPHFQMKEAIKASLLHDSAIVSGTFMPNPHASRNGSFGRAARFSQPQSMAGRHSNAPLYYLSYDMQQLQGPKCRDGQRGQLITASGRGRVGTNVNSHWNDAKGGVAPGPGAYTPRYWFCSNSK